MSRTNLSAVVSRQLPEHIREDYPTFVAFVEAYYEYLQAQGVDFSTLRDIDKTLESFVGQFKKELAYNLPNITQNERFLLQNVKDQYLAKGSEGSYKLLFRLLFGKEVELVYPGRSMLRASDGRWNQEISIFAKVDYGDPEDVVGKLVEIQTATRVLRVLVDRRQDIIGEVDRIVLIDPTRQIYEFFLDKRFFGNLTPGDRIRFSDKFQATILPTTQTIKITQPGKNFRVGQVFDLRSGTGTGALMKITAVTDGGGIKYAEIIKFGIGYTANFSVNILSTNSVTSTRSNLVTSTATLVETVDPLDPESIIFSAALADQTIGFDQQGYINSGDYFTHEYLDGTYAGTLLREFSLSIRNAQTNPEDPAIIEINLGALVKYPGYFETNNGFLDDSIFIQDSKYYQAFSYVLKIDERLSSYSSAVKTMLHPAGMALFGDFDITNNYDLSIDLESLVKSLGFGLEDSVEVLDLDINTSFTKVLSDSVDTPIDVISSKNTGKSLATDYSGMLDLSSVTTTKSLSTSYSGATDAISSKSIDKLLATPYSGLLDTFNLVFIKNQALETSQSIEDISTKNTGKTLETTYSGLLDLSSVTTTKLLSTDYSGILDSGTTVIFNKPLVTTYSGATDAISTKNTGKTLATTYSGLLDSNVIGATKYVTDVLGSQTESGVIQLNSYSGEDIFAEEYSVGSRASTFTTP